MIEKYKEGLG